MNSQARHQEEVRSPGEYILEELQRRGWTQTDLAKILGRPSPTINRIVQGRHGILPEMAIALGAAFENDPALWLQRESHYRLSLTKNTPVDEVKRRKRLYELAPIKELQRRGWVTSSDNLEKIETDLLGFYEITDINEDPVVFASMRMTSKNMDLSPSQNAWCFRVKGLARKIAVNTYNEDKLSECIDKLKKFAAYSQETSKVPVLLAEYGIRLVITEPLKGCKIDGAALWLDENSPVIGMSMRYDRIDYFWFTLCHELSHIRHRDKGSVDADLDTNPDLSLFVKPAHERRADSEAASTLIETAKLESFIKRVGPFYSKKQINQFANSLKIHPGIIVGQLQHKDEIGRNANREMLVKVRDYIIDTSMTDGWGYSI